MSFCIKTKKCFAEGREGKPRDERARINAWPEWREERELKRRFSALAEVFWFQPAMGEPAPTCGGNGAFARGLGRRRLRSARLCALDQAVGKPGGYAPKQ